MKFSLTSPFTTLILALLVIMLLFINVAGCNAIKSLKQNNGQLLAALADTVKYFVNEDGNKVAQIKVLATQSVNDFIKIKTKDTEILKLQGLVSDYKKKLKAAGSSITHTSIETGIDTTIKTEVIPADPIIVRDTLNCNPEYKSSFKNKWITYSSRANKDSTFLSVKFRDEYSTIIGKDKKGVFADVITESPYSEVKNTRTYQVSGNIKPKKWIVALGGGYGSSIKELKGDWFIGIFAGRSILRL